ncbi:LamG domain-containing protein [Actinospica robiniae]|uniref:LamG domain-containing protein n=1 Tax=Actinospica robiniae TaxID=304901 RepID=UPI000552E515|nr:LamG domain-containing protein [Actinospica robiniae]
MPAGRPSAGLHRSGAARGLTAAALATALLGVQLTGASGASADAAPAAPIVSVTADPPAGTTACPLPGAEPQVWVPIGTVCSFTISPNPADTAVPTGYEVAYPVAQSQYVTAADPGNGNSFDAATGVATITIVIDEYSARLTVNTLGAGGQAGPATVETVLGQPASVTGTPQVFSDFDGDGTPDLLAAPQESGDALANGYWYAKGGPGGSVSADAQNLLGVSRLGTGAGGGQFSFVGAEVIPGDWCASGENSVLVYYPPTVAPTEDVGGGFVFCGDGDSDVVRSLSNEDAQQADISSGSLADGNGVNPSELVDAGDLTQNHSGLPDVLAVLDDELVLTAGWGPGAYMTDGRFGGGTCDRGDCAVLSDTPSPDGTLDWDSWKVLGYPTADDGLDLYMWNEATGELVLWTDVTATDAEDDGFWNDFTTLDYTQHVIAFGTGTSTWNQGANLELQVADFNGDGVPDLWAVDTAAGTAVRYTAKVKAAGIKLAKGAEQSLISPAHQWELGDLASGTANQALDTGSDTAYQLRDTNAGVSWTTDATFGAAAEFDGTSGCLETNAPPAQPLPGAIVPASSSFSIGAWVDPSGPGTVLAQAGTDDSGVFLSAAADGTWQFGLNTGDTTAATYAQGGGGSWTAGTWTHVVLTYDATTGHLVLYVGGVRADTVKVAGGVSVVGSFILGANQVDGALSEYFPGEIAHVATFDQALTAIQATNLP